MGGGGGSPPLGIPKPQHLHYTAKPTGYATFLKDEIIPPRKPPPPLVSWGLGGGGGGRSGGARGAHPRSTDSGCLRGN